jgi:hypothetical protein
MNWRSSTKVPVVRLSLVVLAAAIIVVGWTVVRALRAPADGDVPLMSVAALEPITRGPLPPPADIQSAVESDLFSHDRSAPAQPYRMPGESAPDNKPVVEPMKPLVLGTAVANDGRSFATLQLGDATPTLVHVGDKIGEWTVKGIERRKVVLVSTAGSRAELTVPKPGY